jgi:hypothetical protein
MMRFHCTSKILGQLALIPTPKMSRRITLVWFGVIRRHGVRRRVEWGDAATANIPVMVRSRLTEKNRQELITAGRRGLRREEFPDADARGECVAENTRESDLPHQAQRRSRFRRRPTSTTSQKRAPG